ncbi:FlgD Ig-like domain-containing protein, partial [Candidatus Kryptonium thompsonii]
PFNFETAVEFDVPEYSSVKLIVFDVLGRKVRTLVDDKFDPGRKVIKWDARNDSGEVVGSGVYFIVMFANSLESEREFGGKAKVLLLK